MIVADASAILAHIFSEPGGQWLDELGVNVILVSTVNVTEVLSKLMEKGWAWEEAVADLESLGLVFAEYSTQLAYHAGAIYFGTRKKGLSLGDRACLALAIRENATALTAERKWADLDLGCKIELIR